jgi:GNAT superfamily N-acetyltransferase
MVNVVRFDPAKHTDEYVKMNIELMSGYRDQLLEQYSIDSEAMQGQTVETYVKENTEFLTSLKPPIGIIYIIEIDGKIAGTGAIKKFRESFGEIKRMYVRPEFRGNGYRKLLMKKLLETGREYGWRSFILDTPKFAYAAHGLYRSVGFNDREPYPESEVPQPFIPYWMYMEKMAT